ncbi:MAG: pyridoxal phosphate-dependent class II aminotransferase [Oceanospirillaceae bacterium]|nr:pyridoxal phosphate-dependent class II aminotransferase [Oceanospirillaceae bacterium]
MTFSINKENKIIKDNQQQPDVHGGDIIGASVRYNITQSQWIDLSTGLNPAGFPCANIPASAFSQLPYLQPGFLKATAQYYGSSQFVPLIGSQMLIQALPKMLSKRPVLLPDVGYTEHRDSWCAAGFEMHNYPAFDLDKATQSIDSALLENSAQHLVVINPNNPSGLLIPPQMLLAWAAKLQPNCYLIVDEAFIDLTPQLSVLAHQWPANMLVLRSFGKFFGLAGIRIGFAFAQGELRAKIERQLGLWMINGPAQYLAEKAFKDLVWQSNARAQIVADAHLTTQLFTPLLSFLEPTENTLQVWVQQGLFSSYQMSLTTALELQDQFCQDGILLRVIALEQNVGTVAQGLLRIGLLSAINTEQQQRIRRCVAKITAVD